MGVEGELASLARLQAQVEEIAQEVGFAPEEKEFLPHLTLARTARDADRRMLKEVGQRLDNYVQDVQAAATSPTSPTTSSALLSFRVDRVVFYQSELGAGSPRYTVLAEFPFAGD
jgi:2'-5' RNA ligase